MTRELVNTYEARTSVIKRDGHWEYTASVSDAGKIRKTHQGEYVPRVWACGSGKKCFCADVGSENEAALYQQILVMLTWILV